ncbi:CBS domain-containing protein [Streptomyces sp. NBC_00873]|uniref:CBS domain-containing protein n=1 Tax=unclassified Streptomyces TaxID=2593676 RepID=UPI0038640FCC|nr:CBS domain-containing protein [Streptomyces sp. NBC_00873]WTA47269.1 CBS domain-containing protein [Streptomyces sp. NBC_00842]
MKTRTVGEVMTSEVVCASRQTPLDDVVRLLDRHRIRALPVVDHDDKVVGVVSGADLAHGSVATTAGELMTTPAVTIHPEQRVADAARLMERQEVDRLPVVDEEDRLIGIATRRDLLRVFSRTDEEIRQQVVEEVLVSALGLPPDAVAVSVRDGMVMLEGSLRHRSDVPLAVRSTWRLEGVVGVVSRLGFDIDDCRPAQPAAH